MNLRKALLLPVSLLLAQACSPAEPAGKTITIFAAASLTPAIQALLNSPATASQNFRLHTAATSTLARQIESGATADLILTAHPEWIDWLQERDLLEPDSVRDIASNELVWIVPSASGERTPLDLRAGSSIALDTNARLSIGDPAHVPLGRYTQTALRELNLWAQLEAHLTPALDARSALRLVELGEADAGIVYASDAAQSERVFIRARFPRELHPPIRYQAAALRGADSATLDFLDALHSPSALANFRAFGFLPPTP